ncbi:hypothetical protein [Acinetobacter sp. Marseille-Q1618]|uniref:hypothetical protein n=1 Tax=Acinetobacter sp. Marseille-Q1618 TaxID=2697502 RepID=UPI0015715144|nr:hypothetical protein [Acinetobacter sp. Marseille-Q1618]
MIAKKIFLLIKILLTALLVLTILFGFWMTVLQESYYLPVSARYYKCDKPYINAQLINGEVQTTLDRKYCVDLSIPFFNVKGLRNTGDKKYLLLDNQKLDRIDMNAKHTFFKDPDNKKYEIIQRNVGLFYVSYESDKNQTVKKNKAIKNALPKLSLSDASLNEVLFKDY